MSKLKITAWLIACFAILTIVAFFAVGWVETHTSYGRHYGSPLINHWLGIGQENGQATVKDSLTVEVAEKPTRKDFLQVEKDQKQVIEVPAVKVWRVAINPEWTKYDDELNKLMSSYRYNQTHKYMRDVHPVQERLLTLIEYYQIKRDSTKREIIYGGE